CRSYRNARLPEEEGSRPDRRAAAQNQSGAQALHRPAEEGPPKGLPMPEIKPRWEWRTFGTRFARAEAAFAKLETKGVQETDEIYLLTEKGSNVKVRAALLDIKVLQKVNEAGLEQWMPVMKEGFPATAATLRKVFNAMQVTPPDLKRDDYTFDQFLDELIEPTKA